jgi:hypothetical protein
MMINTSVGAGTVSQDDVSYTNSEAHLPTNMATLINSYLKDTADELL